MSPARCDARSSAAAPALCRRLHRRGASAVMLAAALVVAAASGATSAQPTTAVTAAAKTDAARLRESIAVSPALKLNVPVRPSVTREIPAPELSNRVEPKLPLVPQPNVMTYRSLTQSQERDVRAVVAKQLKWPDREGNKAQLFQGVVQTVQPGQPEITFTAIAAVDAPLRFVPERKRFEGRIQVGFVEVGGTQPERALNGQYAFQVSGPVTAEPEIVETGKTAPPFQVIKVATAAPEGAVKVVVRSTLFPNGVPLVLDVLRPRLDVQITPARIQGLGLEVADVIVQSSVPGETAGATIQLRGDNARVEPNTLTFDASGVARATIRSSSTGTATVTAAGPLFGDGATRSVAFVTPWRFILAALVGGLAGGIVRKGTKWNTSLRTTLLEMVVAVITGAIVFGLFALGVNVLTFKLPATGGEVLVFVVAALGAFFGTRLLSPAK